MGTLDDHWCNVCRRNLDKKKGKDEYIEFELVNMLPEVQRVLSKKKVKPKGIVCKQCIDADPTLKKALELMIKAGNPLFKPHLHCLSRAECEDYKETNKKKSQCRFISVIKDKIYCRRSHIGTLKLPRDKGEVQREERQILQNAFRRMIKDPAVKKILDTTQFVELLAPVHTPPSTVMEENPSG